MARTRDDLARTGRAAGRGPARLLGAGTAAALLLALAGPAVAAPGPVEDFAPYVGQVSCDPRPKPGTLKLASWVLDRYDVGRSGGIVRACGGASSEHKEGRAWDWMLSVHEPAEKEAGDAFAAWLTAEGPDGRVGYQARRLGVMYVIWDAKWWSAYRPEAGWRAYTGASPHTDHVHVSLSWNGAMGRTSFWTGSVFPTDYGPCRPVVGQAAPVHGSAPRLTPCPTPKPAPSTSPSVVPVAAPSEAAAGTLTPYVGTTLRVGDRGPAVLALQARLGVSQAGVFGRATETAVVAFQKAQRLTADGVVGRATWAALGGTRSAPAATAPMTATPVKATPVKAAPVKGRPVKGRPVKATPVTAPAGTGPATAAPATSLAAHGATVLRLGSRGAAVLALQKRLGVPQAGVFGPATKAAVVAFQKTQRLTADGVVGRTTWTALARTAAQPAPRVVPAVARPATAAASPLAPHARTTLRTGSRGPAVVALQARLRVQQAGVFGPATEAAVVAFQASRRLTADGVVGPATWAALMVSAPQAG